MRTRRNVVGLVIVGAITLAVAGCVQPQPHVIPTSDSSSKPVFATDAEALAAAKKAFTAYLVASDAVANDGGADLDRLAPLDSADQFTRDKKTFSKLHDSGERTTGQSQFSQFTLQSVESLGHGIVRVNTYACIDISQTQLLDSQGAALNTSRPSGVPLELSFRNTKDEGKTLVLDRSVTWQGKNFCS